MIKYVFGLIVAVSMLVGGGNEASAQSCAGGVCALAKNVVTAPVHFMKEVQPVRRVVSASVQTCKNVAAKRPVRTLFGRVASRRCCCN